MCKLKTRGVGRKGVGTEREERERERESSGSARFFASCKIGYWSCCLSITAIIHVHEETDSRTERSEVRGANLVCVQQQELRWKIWPCHDTSLTASRRLEFYIFVVPSSSFTSGLKILEWVSEWVSRPPTASLPVGFAGTRSSILSRFSCCTGRNVSFSCWVGMSRNSQGFLTRL